MDVKLARPADLPSRMGRERLEDARAAYQRKFGKKPAGRGAKANWIDAEWLEGQAFGPPGEQGVRGKTGRKGSKGDQGDQGDRGDWGAGERGASERAQPRVRILSPACCVEPRAPIT